MVNTRRKESSSTANNIGSSYQTRRTETEYEFTLGCGYCSPRSALHRDSDFSAESEPEADQDSLDEEEEQKNAQRPLRSRRECSTIVTNDYQRPRRSYREVKIIDPGVRRSGRNHLAVYSLGDMHDLESDDDGYSPHHSRRRFSRKQSRLERRAALSLRPITTRNYKDSSPAPATDSDRAARRRSLRQRTSSWLTDDHVHKVGYPTRARRYYDDEDSRDANYTLSSNTAVGSSRWNLRQKGKKTYYDHITESQSSPAEAEVKKEPIRSERAESQDKENKQENIVNGKSYGLRKTKEQAGTQTDDEDADENGEEIEEDQEAEAKVEVEEEKEDSEDEVILPRLRSTRNRSRLISENAEKLTDTSSTSGERRKTYSLRQRRPKMEKPPLFTVHPVDERDRSRPKRSRGRHFNHKRSGSSSSSDSDSSTEKRPRKKGSKEQMKTGGGKVLPIAPDVLDPKITFDCVGGLDEHVRCLKEMILLPMMYPEIFDKFQIQPPRGVLFHGPPGTGKTLLARALANECSFGKKKVSFFMRKGADLLSKWIGESEKQLRLLFEQAGEKKPSIIFFDELDGLAPVRTARQDQIHSSIVSTLLALMDGLDNRGEVIVIGATNRIDSIDPALRRPGRFDRELYFPLPARKQREEILKVHVSQWTNPPTPQMLSHLAETSNGYCGSDLRALCSEAVIQSFRRTYPQVYGSKHRLLLQPENVKIEKLDFLRAKSLLVPASHRVNQNISRKLMPVVQPLLSGVMDTVLDILDKTFPHGRDPALAKVKVSASLRPSQLIITADGQHHGQTSHLAPALLHSMEHLFIQSLDLAILHREGGRSPEEMCVQIFHEAKRNVPSVMYIPAVNTFWALASDTVKAIFTSQIAQLDPNSPILIFATADSVYKELPIEIRKLFSKYRNEVFEIPASTDSSRRQFFQSIIVDAPKRLPRPNREKVKTPPPLPRAPTPPPTPISQEAAQKLYEHEERTMRELRIFLRDICKKLASNRLFYMFTKPVDVEEVPDYLQIIKQPMDLETMMTKVDLHRYQSAKDFLEDIELIVQNALEYNPAKTSEDKQIRHRACALRDYAYSLIKSEMDTDFEDLCQDIAKKRKSRDNVAIPNLLPAYLVTPDPHMILALADNNSKEPSSKTENSVENNSTPTVVTRKRKPSWRTYVGRRKKRRVKTNDAHEVHVESEDTSKDGVNETQIMETTNENHQTLSPSKTNADLPTYGTEQSNTIENGKLDDSLQSVSAKAVLGELASPSELLNDPFEDEIEHALNESMKEESDDTNAIIHVSHEELEKVLEEVVVATAKYPLQALLDLHYQFRRIMKKFNKVTERSSLPDEFRAELGRFESECNSYFHSDDSDGDEEEKDATNTADY